MTTVWTYPWAFSPDTIHDEIANLREMGVTGLTVAGHYHSIQTLVPPRDVSVGSGIARSIPNPTSQRESEMGHSGLFASFPGGCHFEPDSSYFEDTAINPPVRDSGTGEDDAFKLVADAANDYGLDVNAWTVCLHNSRLGAANPDYRIESAFGDAHDHGLCPSHPAVRTYFEGVVRSLRDYDVSRIDLESIGYPNALHGHGNGFGHSKNHVLTNDVDQLLISQCFCDGCRAAATDHPVNFDVARSLVRDLLRDLLRGPTAESPTVDGLVTRHKEFRSLLSFRASVVERFVRGLADASGPVPLQYYLADGFGYVPSAAEPAGVWLGRLSEHLDGVTAICYTDSCKTARQRIRQASAAFDGPVNAGVTLDPDVVATEATFRSVATAAREASTGGLEVYNYSLMGEDHIGWLKAVA